MKYTMTKTDARMREEMIPSLISLLEIPSVTERGEGGYPYGSGPARAVDAALEIAAQLGFRTVNKNYEYAYAEVGSGDPLIAVLVHLDVVPAGNGWTKEPFAGTVEDGRIYGRGAIDDKGPAVACLYAVKDLMDLANHPNLPDLPNLPDSSAQADRRDRPNAGALPGRVRILFGQTEESGISHDILRYLEEEETPDAGFTPDGEFPVIRGEKGMLEIQVSMNAAESGVEEAAGGTAINMVPDAAWAVVQGVRYEGVGRAAHGSCPQDGVNAITELCKKLPACPFREAFLGLFGDTHHGEHCGCAFEDEDSGRITVNPGLLTMEEGRLAVDLDVRYPLSYTKEDVLRGLTAEAEKYGMTVMLKGEEPPVFFAADSPEMQALLRAYREETGDEREPLVVGGATYARTMPHIMAYGPLTPEIENREHRGDEYIPLEHLVKLRRIYAKAVYYLLQR